MKHPWQDKFRCKMHILEGWKASPELLNVWKYTGCQYRPDKPYRFMSMLRVNMEWRK